LIGQKILQLILKLQDRLEKIDSILTDVKDASVKLPEVMGKADKVLENVKEAAEGLPDVLEKTKEVMNDVKKATGIIAEEGPRIREMLNATDNMLQDTREIVKGVKESWPVNRLIPEKEDIKLVPLEGLERGY